MNKKILMYSIIIILIGLVLVIGWIEVKNHKNRNKLIINEYVPIDEITTEQLRRTNIILYFQDKNTGELRTEIKQIDSKILLNNPEKQLIEFLMQEPNDNNLKQMLI